LLELIVACCSLLKVRRRDDDYVVLSHKLGNFGDTRQLQYLLLLMASEAVAAVGGRRIVQAEHNSSCNHRGFRNLSEKLGFFWHDDAGLETKSTDCISRCCFFASFCFFKHTEGGSRSKAIDRQMLMKECFKLTRPIFPRSDAYRVYFASCMLEGKKDLGSIVAKLDGHTFREPRDENWDIFITYGDYGKLLMRKTAASGCEAFSRPCDAGHFEEAKELARAAFRYDSAAAAELVFH
jgi:hypothetical protein